MLNDFKAFIARGNVLDLAIGVILGAAFGRIVTTFTEGIVMPFVGLATGGIDFSEKVVNLGAMPVTNGAEIAAKAAKEPLVMYGQLINDILTFLIVGFVMFLLAKWAMGYFTRLAALTPPPQEVLLAEIRDELRER